ncbi:MAG: flagellar protein FlaG [Pseudomonadota bacterium]|nr:flagellar protein FlaG [Pseudomonadota bacterium]MEC8419308.1 flagellar protein FlaG [Pseudomonadota bacterium]
MEIQNTQIGQTIASVPSSAAQVAPVKQDTLPVADADPRSNQQNEQGESRNTSAQPADISSSVVGQNLSQASSRQADNTSSERDRVQLEEAVANVESFLKVQNRDLAFTIDEDTNRSVVTVKDSQSGDVIRQIPSEEVLKLADRIQELQQDVGNSVGVFINNQV